MFNNHKKTTIPRRKFISISIIASSTAFSPLLLTNCSSAHEENPVPVKKPDFIPEGDYGFYEGVASFDPGQNSVILWTRYTPAQNEIEKPQIIIDVAKDAAFRQLVVSEAIELNKDSDNTIHADINSLESNTKYYYRFRNEQSGATSPIGETKTLPGFDQSAAIIVGVVSCANFEMGYFNVYEALADSNVDVVIHLGDYIYEGYRQNHFPGRKHAPEHELLTLDDYRTRYRQYRQDVQLQKAHQLKPFICVWDDHEFANNTYRNGTVGHQIMEGDFNKRIEDAMQAWHEYLPCRTNNKTKIYRSFDIGGIVNLLMLDTRLIGRDKQLDYSDYIELGKINNQFQQDWKSQDRSLLGPEQKSWLINEIQTSTSEWQVLGNQVLMGKHYLPPELIPLMNHAQNYESLSTTEIAQYYKLITELAEIKSKIDSDDPNLTPLEKARFENLLPYNLDSWDGYPVEREEIFKAGNGKKLISIAGASHNAWHNELIDEDQIKIGTEFATASITSDGLEALFDDNPVLNSGIEQTNMLLMDDVRYSKVSKRGFIKITFTKTTATAEWHFVDTIREISPITSIDHTVIET